MKELTSRQEITRVLQDSRTVAVVGFHPSETKPAHYVPEYLARQGYTVIPVNPTLAERGYTFHGQAAVATLDQIEQPVDVVEVFRRSEHVGEHLQDILRMKHRPRTVWLQQGIRNDDVASVLIREGVQVVQDRCMLTDHRGLP